MKKNKNRVVRAAICIGVSVVLLTMAVFANYDNANGYSTIKTAAKNMLYTDNMTVNASMEANIDGVSLGKYDGTIKLDKTGDVKMQSVMNFSSGEYTTKSLETVQDGYRYNKYDYDYDGTSYDHSSGYKYRVSDDSFPMIMDRDNEMFTKGVNLVETLCDTLIGDVKNNIVLENTNGDSRTYRLNMTGEQLPKYMTAAFSFFCASQRADNTLNEQDIELSETEQLIREMFLGQTEPFINSVNGSATVDEQNRITGFDGKLIITGYDNQGNVKDMTFDICMTAGEFGTTAIERVNPDEYEDVMSYATTDESGNEIIVDSVDKSEATADRIEITVGSVNESEEE